MRNWIILAILTLYYPATAHSSEMVEIPAGSFIMGNHGSQTSHQRTINLDNFFIDRFEVTNAEFSARFPGHTYPPGADQHPVTSVTWSEAGEFCLADNKRLPTEAEWEKAARGPDGRVYPWGDKNLKKKPHPFFSGIIKRKVGYNKKDASYYGVRDMAGSVWEWTATDAGEKKVTRGGLWNLHLDFEYSKTYERNLIAPASRFVFLGFRCARSK
ncbi:MAG: formylglycine-generating enzyme family protein [Nitrospinales bacterium]